jgi:Ca-activated chloride channel family protein
MFDPGLKFANSEFLFLLLVIPILIYWYVRKQSKSQSDIQFSAVDVFKTIKRTSAEWLRHVLFVLRILAIALLIVGFARPQKLSRGENIYTEGIDIVMVLDISGSMLAEDFRPNRIEAAKQVAGEFIEGRTTDRIGLVVFSGQSFTQCPMTADYGVIRNLLTQVKSGMIEDGTAIGMAISTGVGRLKDSKAKSKVMILLTDGINNRGAVDPITAAQMAQTFGIRIYTVGVGSMGEAPYPVQTPLGVQYATIPVEIDEKMLKEIADMTGGKYFRATDNKKLRQIYSEIDKMEKTRVEVKEYRRYQELFYGYVGLGLALLLCEIGLSNTVFRKIP